MYYGHSLDQSLIVVISMVVREFCGQKGTRHVVSQLPQGMIAQCDVLLEPSVAKGGKEAQGPIFRAPPDSLSAGDNGAVALDARGYDAPLVGRRRHRHDFCIPQVAG